MKHEFSLEIPTLVCSCSGNTFGKDFKIFVWVFLSVDNLFNTFLHQSLFIDRNKYFYNNVFIIKIITRLLL